MNNTVAFSPQRTQLIDLVLQGVSRPKFEELKATVAEIVSIEKEKAENLQQSAHLPKSDPQLRARRRDIDSRLEELYARQTALQPAIVEETARLLDEQIAPYRERDEAAKEKTSQAKVAFEEAERARLAAAQAYDAVEADQERIRISGSRRLTDAIVIYRDMHPELYDGNTLNRVPNEVPA